MKLTKTEIEIYEFTCKNYTREILNAVYIEETRLTATNGHLLVVVKIKNPDEQWKPVAVSRDWMQTIFKKMKKTDHAEFSQCEDEITATIVPSGTTFTTKKITGNYAKREIIDNQLSNDDIRWVPIRIDAKYLSDVSSYVSKFNEKNNFITINFNIDSYSKNMLRDSRLTIENENIKSTIMLIQR